MKKVEERVQNGLSLEFVVQSSLRDRPSKDVTARAGQPCIMSVEEFPDAVSAVTRNDRGSNGDDVRQVLENSDRVRLQMLGKDPDRTRVHQSTVKKYVSLLGGDDLIIRRKVSKRTYARVQAARSMMHLVTYLFTTICSHVLVADDGIGEEIP